MKALVVTLILFCFAFVAIPAHALECANVGTAWVTQPDDTGDNGATACGEGAVAGGNDSTALGYDASAIGDDSTALGFDAVSTGFVSTAVGSSTRSAGAGSTALGSGASSAGDASTALGRSASSGGLNSTALGYLASSAGDISTALGHLASSGGAQSTALGYSASAGADYSTSLGYLASSGGIGSHALGAFASSVGITSTAVGYLASSAGNSSTALGLGASAAGDYSTAIGIWASAPNPDTIVLGEIPGVNSGQNFTAVANGTTAPLAPLHIFRDDGTAQVLVEETSPDAVPRTLFRLASAGSNAKFEIDNTAAGVNWAFTNSGGDFRISRQGSGVVEFRVDNAGNAFVAGDLEVGGNLITNLAMLSDRKLKQNIEALDPEDVLEKVAALPVSAWEYSDRPGERHIGPMAQDFHAAFGLGSDDTAISVVDASGVALASIKALNEKLDSQNAALESRNRQLENELKELRALVMQLLPQVAQN